LGKLVEMLGLGQQDQSCAYEGNGAFDGWLR
jgi:hypothetical protein